MVAVPRNNKVAPTIANMRGVLCANIMGKLVTGILRIMTVPYLDLAARNVQHGALPGSGIEVPTLFKVLFVKSRQIANRCCAILFMDLRRAFYSAMMEQVVGTMFDGPERRKHMREMGFDESVISNFEVDVQAGGFELGLLGAPSDLVTLLAAYISTPWFTVQDDPTSKVCVHRGAFPGVPLADLMFAIIFARVQREIVAALQAPHACGPLIPNVDMQGVGFCVDPTTP